MASSLHLSACGPIVWRPPCGLFVSILTPPLVLRDCAGHQTLLHALPLLLATPQDTHYMTASGRKGWDLNPESGAPEYFTLMFKWTGALFHSRVYLLGLTQGLVPDLS